MTVVERLQQQVDIRGTANPFGALAADALDEMEKLARYAQHLQARIDALMLEYCPAEMTPEQIAEWERHQKAVPNA